MKFNSTIIRWQIEGYKRPPYVRRKTGPASNWSQWPGEPQRGVGPSVTMRGWTRIGFRRIKSRWGLLSTRQGKRSRIVPAITFSVYKIPTELSGAKSNSWFMKGKGLWHQDNPPTLELCPRYTQASSVPCPATYKSTSDVSTIVSSLQACWLRN